MKTSKTAKEYESIIDELREYACKIIRDRDKWQRRALAYRNIIRKISNTMPSILVEPFLICIHDLINESEELDKED